MGRTRQSKPTRKRRTREHIIADLSVHHAEGPILRCGFTAERFTHDYGVDLYMTTYSRQGEVENDFVLLQLKASDHLRRAPDGTSVFVRLERRDLEWWFVEAFPVILVLYDAQNDRGYWLYLQEHFGPKGLPRRGHSLTVRIPIANLLDENAIRRFAAAKAAIQAQIRGVKHHE